MTLKDSKQDTFLDERGNMRSQFIGTVHGQRVLTDDLMIGFIEYPEGQKQKCVIRSLPADADDLSRARFVREAMLGIELTRGHENLLTTIHFGRWHDERLFIAFEHVTGPTVNEKRGELEGDFVVIQRIAESTTRALVYMHRRGFVHRAVAAENLVIGSDGIIRLGSLSEAKRTSEPEDKANDLRSLGALLFELVFGMAIEDGPEDFEIENADQAPVQLLLYISLLLAGSDGSAEEMPMDDHASGCDTDG